MSFFDEDDPQPTRRETAARPARPRPGGGGPGRPPAADHQTLLIRRAIALGAAVLLLVLAFIALRGCLDARHESQLEDYNTRLGTIVRASDESVGQPFFARLAEGGESPQDLQEAVNGYRATAEQQLAQAEDLDPPDEMRAAHQSALIALEYRANGLEGISQRIRPALGDQSEQTDQAIGGIAGQMQSFLASDVTWQARVVPLINDALAQEDVRGPAANTQRFLTDLSWLQEETVADRLGRQLSDGGGGGDDGADEEPAPGLHGTGLVAVGAGEATLQPGAANRIPAGAETLTVRFANQGENDESEVRVVVKVDPIEGGGETITLQKTVDSIAAGAEETVSMPLTRRPPAGSATTISVEVRPVPGEEKTDNNKQEYEAIFEG